ncbi:adenosine deaminase [Galactobacter valiniphilus]|uniref:adenosine deaminase n=1 Tax=Galactobacter valiniphilus TaxID=2676122 RepID=A0A399JK59_9MICC|nr:adenosine deaminase [Galactobacter valiniphilus]RII42876.1 adenosine deaminase [Galactobacter valiniphilus]
MSENSARERTLDIRDLPKVSLHDHLDGGLRPATIIDLAAGAGVSLPASTPEALGEWFRESADSGSLERYLETFAITIGVMQDAASLTRVAREFVEDLIDDGVVYAEVRWAPEQHTTKDLTMAEAVAAVQDGIDEAVQDARDADVDIEVGQILSAMRQNTNSFEVAELALQLRDAGVVGFDLAGPEDGFPASDHKNALDLLAANLFPVTLHAGEAAGLLSIQSALVDGRALRLGHGVRLAEDLSTEEIDGDDDEAVTIFSAGTVATWVRDRGIALEICPSSNLQTGATAAWASTLDEHPVDVLFRTGFNVTISPDNRLMSGTTLSDELALLVEAFDYDAEDLLELTLNAVEASFLGLDERRDLAELIADAYEDLIEDADDDDDDDEDEDDAEEQD